MQRSSGLGRQIVDASVREKLLVFAEALVTVGTPSFVATNDIVVEKVQRLAKNELLLLFYFLLGFYFGFPRDFVFLPPMTVAFLLLL
ncbi:hypothetical protein Peur_070837 [Populus x canadensis]